MNKILSKTLRDIFSPEVLLFVLVVGIASVLVWIVPLWWLSGTVVHLVSWLSTMTPWAHQWKEPDFWSVLKIGYILVTVTISIATAIWGEEILRKLARKHYPHLTTGGRGKIHRSLYYNLKANGTFLLLLLVTFPLLFIPYFGKGWLLWLWSIQLREPTVYDVGALLNFNNRRVKQYTRKSRWVSLLAAALNFIPIVNFFVPLFAQILFMHTIMEKESRNA